MAESVRFLKPSDLRGTVRGLAIMAALFDRSRDCRFRPDPPTGCDVGTWGDPAGNHCHFLFPPAGAVVLGFDHESPMSPHAFASGPDDFRPWPGVYDELPERFAELVRKNPFGESFDPAEVTFCLWNRSDGLDWKKGSIQYPGRVTGDPDGSGYILGRFRGYFDHFDNEMNELYGRSFDADTLFQVFSDEPLSPDDLRRLKPDLDAAAARELLREIGWSA
jgi:hypothetical protein